MRTPTPTRSRRGRRTTPSTSGSPRLGWFPYLLPYLEQDAVFREFNFTAGTTPAFGTVNSATTTSPTAIVIGTYLCPSDPGPTQGYYPWGHYSLGNYAPFFGGLDMGGANPAVLARHAARRLRAQLGGCRFIDFQDGTSNTMIFGEYLRSTGLVSGGYGQDQRGMLWQSDEPGGGHIYTRFTPNTTNPDIFYPTWWCVDRPPLNLPCVTGSTDGSDHTSASRSRHTDGVSVAMGDGSVRFVAQSVDLMGVWRPMATIAGGEVASFD